MGTTAVVWFRNDLRLEENPAWAYATADHDVVIPVVVIDPVLLDSVGPFRRNLFLANVNGLDSELRELGASLSIVVGNPRERLSKICDATGASGLYFNRATSAYGRSRDNVVARTIPCEPKTFWGTLLTEPGTVLTAKGTLSKVFTPFWKQWAKTPLPERPSSGSANIGSLPTSHTGPLPNFSHADFSLPNLSSPTIIPGNEGAHLALQRWLDSVDDYLETRDLPFVEGTSQLSGHLRFGTISPRTIFDAVGTATPGREAFVRQLAWRDWYGHLLLETPTMIDRAVKSPYDNIEWRNDAEGLNAWKLSLIHI